MSVRELWEFLESGQDFSTWIKARIEQYSFEERQDYTVTNHKVGVRSNVTQIDYHISLDMAKELGMAERTAKGKMVRLAGFFFDKTSFRFYLATPVLQQTPDKKMLPSSSD